MDKKWATPKLILLTRDTPENIVLRSCKMWITLPYGPNGNFTTCSHTTDPIPTGASRCFACRLESGT